MPSTTSGPESSGGTDPAWPKSAHAYFQAVETLFIALRGSPLMLAPADWQVTKAWYEEGIPLGLVENTLRGIFERRHENDEKDKVLTLRRVRKSVERAWEEQKALHAPAAVPEAPEFDVPARLASLAASLPDDLLDRDLWQRRIETLKGSPEEIEERLARLDKDLMRHGESSLDATQRAEIERDLETSLAALRHRLDSAELERAEQRLREQVVRGRLDLPLLSLFAVAP